MEGVPRSNGSVNMSEDYGFTKRAAAGRDLSVLFSFLFIFLVTADQLIKLLVVNQVKPLRQIELIEGFFSLHYAENTGSAFSLFADKPWGIYFLSGVSVVLGVLIFILMIVASRKNMKLIALAFCLLSSGAVGNLIDRVRLRYVVDFLRFDFGEHTFPIFNFADICAVLGTVLLICIIIFGAKYFEKFWNVLFKKKEKQNAD